MQKKVRRFPKSIPIHRIDEHLDNVSDVTTLILKGHLLVEEALYAVIEKKLSNPEHLTAANLRFVQLSYLAKALFYKERDAAFWDAITVLNALRNRLAHRLEPSATTEELRRLSVFMPTPKDSTLNHSEASNTIHYGLGAILGFLWTLPHMRRRSG
jgi:hypothetical protein